MEARRAEEEARWNSQSSGGGSGQAMPRRKSKRGVKRSLLIALSATSYYNTRSRTGARSRSAAGGFRSRSSGLQA